MSARHRLPFVRKIHPAAFFRAVRWALPKGYRAYPIRAGRLYLDVSEAPTMLMRVLRLYEPEKHRALKQVLRPGMTFVDVGACKGDFTLFAAAAVGSAGRVVAVEPEPGNVTWLRKSIARNDARNVEVAEMALSDQRGQAILHRADVTAGVQVSSGWHSLVGGGHGQGDEIVIATETLDGLLDALGITRVDVLKIDVEGWEEAVLAGAKRTLSGQRPPILMMDLHPGLGVSPLVIARTLANYGYETYSMASPTQILDVKRDTLELLARRSGTAPS